MRVIFFGSFSLALFCIVWMSTRTIDWLHDGGGIGVGVGVGIEGYMEPRLCWKSALLAQARIKYRIEYKSNSAA